MSKKKIIVCTKGKTCKKLGSKDVYCSLEKQIEKMGLEKDIILKKSDCLGACGRGPAVKVKPNKWHYGRVSPDDCKEILRSLVKKSPIERLFVKR